MNKTLIGAVLAVFVLAGGWYIWQRGDKIQFDPTKDYAISDEFGGSAATEGELLSLLDLLAGREGRRCLMALDLGNAKVEGLVYAAPGRVRGTFQTVTAPGAATSHILIINDTTYSWVDGFKVGLSAPLETSPRPAGGGGVDVQSKFKYLCQPWTVDNAVFNRPADVEFNS